MHNKDKPEPAEPDHKASFALRTAASKEVYEEMTVDEQAAVDRQAELAASEPTPADIQER